MNSPYDDDRYRNVSTVDSVSKGEPAMDKYGPLYHRNSKLLPKGLAKSVIGVVILIGIVEFILGLTGLLH